MLASGAARTEGFEVGLHYLATYQPARASPGPPGATRRRRQEARVLQRSSQLAQLACLDTDPLRKRPCIVEMKGLQEGSGVDVQGSLCAAGPSVLKETNGVTVDLATGQPGGGGHLRSKANEVRGTV